MKNIFPASVLRHGSMTFMGSSARACLPGFPPHGGLAQGALHDLYAASPADAVTTGAFGLGLAVGAAAGRPVVWGLDAMSAQETGQPYAPGLNEMGLRPRDLLLVRARDIATLLSVGEEALRNPAVGAVVLSAWGEARAMNLTASRRLSMAARTGGATVFLVRAGAEPAPSAAESRWSIRSAASLALEAGAPGNPVFSARLQRHRGGGVPRTWTLEWDRDRRAFVETAHASATLSGDLVPLAAQRPVAPRGRRPGDALALRRLG